MAPLTPAQQAIVEAAVGAFAREPRVESVWLSGSLATGEGDAWSDVDLIIAVEAEALPALVAAYGRDPSAIAPAAHVKTLHGRIVHIVTEAWARFDLLFLTPQELALRAPEDMARLHARPGAAAPAGAPAAPQPPSDAQLEDAAREFIRMLGVNAVVLARGQIANSFEGMNIMRALLIDLMLAERGRTRAGLSPKSLERALSAAHVGELAALPPFAATRAINIAGLEAVAQAYLPRAKALFAARGLAWPAAFEAATRRWLAANGVTI